MLRGMSDVNARIEQWEKITESDPTDATAWFSLGNAYKEAGRGEDAAKALRKAIALDTKLSRAHQVLGQVLLKLERHEEAGEVLTEGYKTAAIQGDVMPQRAMGSLLEKVGLPVPEIRTEPPKAEEMEVSEDQIVDRRTGQPGPKLKEPPMRGVLGEFIQANYTATTWREWIGMGTKVINEMRLDFSRVDHQDAYEKQMMDWLGITAEDLKNFESQARQA